MRKAWLLPLSLFEDEYLSKETKETDYETNETTGNQNLVSCLNEPTVSLSASLDDETNETKKIEVIEKENITLEKSQPSKKLAVICQNPISLVSSVSSTENQGFEHETRMKPEIVSSVSSVSLVSSVSSVSPIGQRFLVQQIDGDHIDPHLEWLPAIMISEPNPPARCLWIFELEGSGQRVPVAGSEEWRQIPTTLELSS